MSNWREAKLAYEKAKEDGVKGVKLGQFKSEALDAAWDALSDVENDAALSEGVWGAMEVPTEPIQAGGYADSEEWEFVQQACAQLKPPQSGSSAGLVKWAFNDMDARVKNWRVARALIEKLGVGATWPQFTSLGLDHRTGRPLHDHSVLSDDWIPDYKPDAAKPDSRESEPQPTSVEPVYRAPETTAEGSMPTAPGQQAPRAEDEAEKMRAMVEQQIAAKGEPELAGKQ